MLALGSGIGRLIAMAAIPFLTRLYTPEDFGVLSVFTSLVAIVAPLISLRYVQALPLPRHEGVAMNLLAVSSMLILGLSALVALALWLWGKALLAVVSMEALAPWWWLIALGVLGTATYEMLTMWATRRRAYRVIAQTNVTQSIVGAVVKIALGLMSLQPLGLLVGQVVSEASGIGQLLRGFFIEFRNNWHHVSMTRMTKAAWRHMGFPIWRLPSQFLLVFSMRVPVVATVSIFGSATGGQLGLAMMIVALPINLIGTTAGKALYGEAAQIGLRDPRRLMRLARTTQVRLLAIAIIPTVFLFFTGPKLFSFFFGSEWELAGKFASALSVSLLFQFTSAPMMQMLNLFDAQRAFFAINLVRVIGLLSIFGIIIYFGLGAMKLVTLLALFNAIAYASISAFVFLQIRRLSNKVTRNREAKIDVDMVS